MVGKAGKGEEREAAGYIVSEAAGYIVSKARDAKGDVLSFPFSLEPQRRGWRYPQGGSSLLSKSLWKLTELEMCKRCF